MTPSDMAIKTAIQMRGELEVEIRHLNKQKETLDGFYYLSVSILIMSICTMVVVGGATVMTAQDYGGGVIDWHNVAVFMGICLVVAVILGFTSLILNHYRGKVSMQSHVLRKERDSTSHWY